MRPPEFHPNRSIGRRVIAFPTFCIMAAVRHLEYEFCYSGPPTQSTMRFDYPVKIWYQSDIPRWRYCDFIILSRWLKNAQPGPLPLFFWGGGLNPLKLWVVIQSPKSTSLGDDASFKPQTVKIPGFDLGAIARKKYPVYNQDRTTKKSQFKRNISHTWGGSSP